MKIKIKFKELKKPLFGKYAGITLIPYVFWYIVNKSEYQIKILKNHELIHAAQVQDEIDKRGLIIGWVFWYSSYIVSYLKNIFKDYFSTKGMSGNEAYRNIPAEKEAYANEKDLDYLKNRPKFAIRKYE